MSRFTDIDDRTKRTIEAQGADEHGRPKCGCHIHPSGGWWLCQYHEGFSDALEVVDDYERGYVFPPTVLGRETVESD